MVLSLSYAAHALSTELQNAVQAAVPCGEMLVHLEPLP